MTLLAYVILTVFGLTLLLFPAFLASRELGWTKAFFLSVAIWSTSLGAVLTMVWALNQVIER